MYGESGDIDAPQHLDVGAVADCVRGRYRPVMHQREINDVKIIVWGGRDAMERWVAGELVGCCEG